MNLLGIMEIILLMSSGAVLLIAPLYFLTLLRKRKADKTYDFEKRMVTGVLVVLVLFIIFIKSGLQFMELFKGKIGG